MINTRSRSLRLLRFSNIEQQFFEGWEGAVFSVNASLSMQLGRHKSTPVDRIEAHDPLLPFAGSDSVPLLGIMLNPGLRCDPCRRGQANKWKAHTDDVTDNVTDNVTDDVRGGECEDLHISLAQAEDKRIEYRGKMRLVEPLSQQNHKFRSTTNRDRRGTLFDWVGGARATSRSSLFQVVG